MCTHNLVLSKNKKRIKQIQLKIVIFKAIKICSILHRRVIVMILSLVTRKPTLWFPTWSDTNRAVQLQKIDRGLKFRIYKVEGLYSLCSETKALISFAVTAKLICIFVFAYAKCWFSHDVALFTVISGICFKVV